MGASTMKRKVESVGFGRGGFFGRQPRARRRVIVVASVLAVGGLVAGCGPERSGSAAVVGDARITDVQLSDQVNVVTSALGIQTSAKANQVVLDRLIRAQLYTDLADKLGIVVSDGEVQKFINETEAQVGGAKALADQLLQSGVPQSEIFGFARTFMQQRAIAEKLAPGRSQEEQGAALGTAVTLLSKEIGTQVSPRFGTWEPENLSVGAPPNDLSEPLPTSGSPMMQMPGQGQGSTGGAQGGTQQAQ